MKKYDVVCPHCCGVFHETNGLFREDVPAKGHMFSLKKHCADAGWTSFPPYDTTEYANLVCPSCDQPYVDSHGMVVRLQHIGEIEEVNAANSINARMDALLAEYDPDLPENDVSNTQECVERNPEWLSTQYAEVEVKQEEKQQPATRRRGRRKKA